MADLPIVRTPATSGVAQGALPNMVQPGVASGALTLPTSTSNIRPPVVNKPFQAQRNKVYQRREQVSGQLRSLSHASEGVHSFLLGASSVTNAVVINFPSMPDILELARKAEYRVTSNFVIPDGIHQYKGTAPLEIPFSFSLHAFDDEEYCEHGALTLLHIASRLHALTLPINRNGTEVVASAPGELAAIADTSDQAAEKRAVDSSPTINRVSNPPLFPVACRLSLMYTGDSSPGINCTGYVSQVNIKFKGPWLRSNVPNVINLPTSADYSFVFVHRPGHTNRIFTKDEQFSSNITLGVEANAYADDVKNQFYNTVGLLSGRNIGFEGFNT